MSRQIGEACGIPVVSFDGDQADPRNFSEAQYDTRVQGLTETHGSKQRREIEMAAKELLAQLHEVAANPRKQLDKYLAEGKKVVAVTYYTPQEIVHSMGLVPMGVWGADMEINEAKKYYPAFICSIMQTILELGIKGEYKGISAIIIPSLCDSLKTLGQNWKYAVKDIPFIPMTHPQNRKPDFGIKFTKAGYERVINDLTVATEHTSPSSRCLSPLKYTTSTTQL